MDGLLIGTAVCLGMTAVFLIMAILNVLLVKNVARYPDSKERPRVSVIVPARNEERTIGPCVVSLLGQDYAPFEVIVVNDHSEDSTARIIAELQAEHPQLRMLDCAALPPGWTGKNWACHEGFRQARGELILFTDADTKHGPRLLRKAVAALLQERADLLTVIPRFATISLAEKAIMPALIWLAYSVFPFALMNKNRLRMVAYANGAFMLFSRAAYRHIGGHAAVRDNVIEDLALGARIRRAGRCCVAVNGAAVLYCRMYTCLREIYGGFAKNLFRFFSNALPTGMAIAACVVCWLCYCLVYLAPVGTAAAYLLLRLQGVVMPPAAAVVAGMAIVCSCSSYFLVAAHFRYPRRMTVLYPLTIFLLFTIAMNAIVRTVTGQARWKGRSLPASRRE